MAFEPIRIGIADFNVACAPISLVTTGLGSCVAICLWDPKVKIGGVVHIMLPDSSQARNLTNKAKFADTGIRLLIEIMQKKGAQKKRLVAKIAGGAQMFSFKDNDTMKIGERNVEAVKKELALQEIKILGEDVGGNHGRSIEFFTESGILVVKSLYKGVKII